MTALLKFKDSATVQFLLNGDSAAYEWYMKNINTFEGFEEEFRRTEREGKIRIETTHLAMHPFGSNELVSRLKNPFFVALHLDTHIGDTDTIDAIGRVANIINVDPNIYKDNKQMYLIYVRSLENGKYIIHFIHLDFCTESWCVFSRRKCYAKHQSYTFSVKI